jgi:hypothetical protein
VIDDAVVYKGMRKDLVCVEELLGTVYKCLAVRRRRVDAGAVVEGLMGVPRGVGTSRWLFLSGSVLRRVYVSDMDVVENVVAGGGHLCRLWSWTWDLCSAIC